jgi:hypothetical protein
VTNTPLQALSLLNNKFMEHVAASFAKRLEREAPQDLPAQIGRGYALALGREASDDERRIGEEFAQEHSLAQWCLVMLNLNEFMYVD